MNCETFRKLVSLEIDGRIAPEGEASLMQHVALCRECAEHQQWAHETHRLLGTSRKPVASPGLSERVLSGVLARASMPPMGRLHRFADFVRSGPGLRNAAAIAFLVSLAGVSGWMVGRENRDPLQALHTRASEQRASERARWLEMGLPAEAAERILAIRVDFEARLPAASADPIAQSRLHDDLTAGILKVLSAHPQVLDRYLNEVGMNKAELETLLRRKSR